MRNILSRFARFRTPEGAAAPPPQAPLTAFTRAPQAWFEVYGVPVVERTRYFVLALLLALALLAAAVALAVTVPLKSVVPYVIERNDNGAVTPMPAAAQKYLPGAAEKRYFIAQWARKLLTIDRYFTETYLSEAYLSTRGKATAEFTDWLQRNAPIAELQKDPSLTRTVSISSVSLLQDDVALVRLATERRSMSNPEARTARSVLTVNFVVQAPKTEEELFRNPIGLFVSHFSINDDLEK
jgi:type IV secretion system protein TrbF